MSTYNRAKFIGMTLQSIIPQLSEGTELVIVDGGSTDETPQVVQEFLQDNAKIRYIRFEKNSGLDHDFDQAVEFAKGEYCWLMSDDDLIYPNAVQRILEALQIKDWEAIVLNYEVYTKGFESLISPRKIPIETNKTYNKNQLDDFFIDTAEALSYLGALVIKKQVWTTRERPKYFGSFFIHLGVLFQALPTSEYLLIADPLIKIRYGNAQWTNRSFEIWMFKWPEILWNAFGVSAMAKGKVCPKEPWTNIHRLATLRALGAYNLNVYRTFLAPRDLKFLDRIQVYFLALIPGFFVNFLAILFYGMKRHDRVMLQDLSESRYCLYKRLAKAL